LHPYTHQKLTWTSALVLEELNQPSPELITDRLKTMPKGITGMYELILQRLGSKGNPWEHTMRRKLLLWVTLGARPVKVPEMQYACVTIEGRKSFNPDGVVLPTVKQMIALCGPLLEVYDQNQLRFTHRTVKEFLLQPLDKLSELSRTDERVTSYMVNEDEGNAWMAMTCGKQFTNARLGVLNHFIVTQLLSTSINKTKFTQEDDAPGKSNNNDDDETEGSTDVEAENQVEQERKLVQESPFDYAISYWLKHAMDVPDGRESTTLSKLLWELVRDFFWDKYGANFAEWLRFFAPVGEYHETRNTNDCTRWYNGWTSQPTATACIHIAAAYGLVDVLEWSHPIGSEFNVGNDYGTTPLMVAIFSGEEAAVKVILSKKGVNINQTRCGDPSAAVEECQRLGCTALEYTCEMVDYRPRMVELLLEQPGIKVDLVCHGYTALGRAIHGNYTEGIALLVGAGAKIALYNGEVLTIPTFS
jgi:hypothetical protein